MGQTQVDTLSPKQRLDSLHSPKKATLFSAVIPGAGQVYNNSYRLAHQKSKLWWKLPIIYGSLATVTYFAIENNKFYKEFYNERKNRLDPNYTPTLYPTLTSDQLYPVQEIYRKRRDYSIIGGLAIYVLNIVDANVEGHLLHFDASDDLTIDFVPSINFYTTNTANINLGVRFRWK